MYESDNCLEDEFPDKASSAECLCKCLGVEENALHLQIKGIKEAEEHCLSQGIGAVVILVLDSQSGTLIFHTNITPAIDARKLRNEQF